MSKKILAILSNFGYRGVELTGRKLEATGYTPKFATPRGAHPTAQPPNHDPEYLRTLDAHYQREPAQALGEYADASPSLLQSFLDELKKALRYHHEAQRQKNRCPDRKRLF